MLLRIVYLVEDRIANFIKQAEASQGIDEIVSFVEIATELLAENPNHIQLFHARAELYTRQQRFSLAINDFRSILELDKLNTKAEIKIEQLLLILKYQNLDIFESPNTNFDPWLD